MFCASAHPWKCEFVASHSSSPSSSGRSWGKVELFFFPLRRSLQLEALCCPGGAGSGRSRAGTLLTPSQNAPFARIRLSLPKSSW